ncbi:MAG TPA: metallophosphoesterase family protein [Thermomicrobiales bacterium]|nr:metallophosphoesterase family protein [Thermomicrobiales bacterium]
MGQPGHDLPPDGPVWPTTEREFAAPLTIGVISDTHVYARGARRVSPHVHDLFRRFGCGLIVHCGDANVGEVLDDLAEIAPLVGVVGNNDDDELQDRLPKEAWFDVGPHRFAAVHGHGTARQSARTTAKTYARRASCVIFGHSHEPLIEAAHGAILFNPGSATDRRWHAHFGIGLIHVTTEAIRPELVLFDHPAHLVNVHPDDPPVAGNGSIA